MGSSVPNFNNSAKTSCGREQAPHLVPMEARLRQAHATARGAPKTRV
eukprot:CAMPEP_0198498374 /NCGR_PEP_ID=MMETSP1462-20131121/6973_1 /TAXON_ID=1333877 /ORGANISM="Brandtodinium nutriculum, Strain RCC3387" /LENGTH=46 /DNA_ID= /DNA_START= /DNA_END= /DNA_ORIENTATION=